MEIGPKERPLLELGALRRAALVLAGSLALAACGGGTGVGADAGGGTAGGGLAEPSGACDTATGTNCGQLLLAATDAEGDFVSYSVDVLSVQLERPNGTTVELLPATTRIDFAQLTDMADLLSAATVVPGAYTGGTIRLDYAAAEVLVEAGGEIVAAEVVDEAGQALGVAELEIVLPQDRPLVVTRGRTALLSIDFDLAASHDVDTQTSPPRVTARPYVVAEIEPVDEKELRVRGALVDVDTAASTYVVDVRPWHRRLGRHGRLRVHTTAATAFEIEGVGYTGAEGLAALDTLDPGTLTVAFGTLTTADRSFEAEIVHAGASVGGEGIDAVHGNVVARDGDRLTVKGAFAVRRDRDARAHRVITVTIGPDTGVLKTGEPGTVLGADAISVGQHIVAFGTFLDAAASDAAPVLDATDGRVRLAVTHLAGTVVAAQAGQLDIALRAIDRLGVGLFDFSGTGMNPGLDADPARYEVATATLGASELEAGEAVKVLGFVRPFGSAPADFEGRTIVDRGALRAVLGITWTGDGTHAPFTTLGAGGIVLDLANPDVGTRHHIVVGGRVVDLQELAGSPLIVAADGRTVFGLAEHGHIELFREFDDFTDAVARRLAAGDELKSFAANGSYDPAPGTLEAHRIVAYWSR